MLLNGVSPGVYGTGEVLSLKGPETRREYLEAGGADAVLPDADLAAFATPGVDEGRGAQAEPVCVGDDLVDLVGARLGPPGLVLRVVERDGSVIWANLEEVGGGGDVRPVGAQQDRVLNGQSVPWVQGRCQRRLHERLPH